MIRPVPADAVEPANAETGEGPLLSRALALQHEKNFHAAEDAYRRFLATHPKHLVALNNAALTAKALGRHEVALMRLGKAVKYHPDAAEAHFNLGNTLQEMDRLEDAAAAYRRAIMLRPGYVKAHLNLGNALDKLRRFEEAASAYRQALGLGGDDAETHCNLGHCYKAQAKSREALTHFICAATLAPERADFHHAVGIARFEIRDYEEAIAAFRRVLALEPGHEAASSALLFLYQLTCAWSDAERLLPAVRDATDRALATGTRCSEGALESITRDADPRRNLAVAAATARAFVTPAPLRQPMGRRTRAREDRIRLGYLSVDFREHAVAHVISGIFGRHDRKRFQVTAYSYGIDDGSSWRRRIAQDCDRFVDLYGVADDDAARRICEDGTDILVDLTVWTHGNRARICALRPAAVQVQYLGYPGTSGAPFFDYAIVDRTVVPAEAREFWSERLVFMPETYFTVDRDQPIAATGVTRQAYGLPADAVVFCSFNQSHKIEPVAFGAWMRILGGVKGSVLWLPQGHLAVEANLRAEAERLGVAGDRLVFAAKLREKAEHLERLALADLALDTLAYNGHTTTTDALWAGVPVVTVIGRHFASRVSAGILKAVGLEELVARDLEDYVRLALRLARSPSERAGLRARLRAAQSSSPLFDTARSTACLERAYELMWKNFRDGMPPSDIHL